MPTLPDPDLLTTREAAALLRLQPRTLQKRAREGRGPTPVREGRRLLWRREDVLGALQMDK